MYRFRIEDPSNFTRDYLIRKFIKRNIILRTVIPIVLFYISLIVLTDRTSLMMLQLLNAIFMTIIANIVMFYSQNMMPVLTDFVTTLFTNSIASRALLLGVLQATSENIGYYVGY